MDSGNFPFNASQLNSILVYSNLTLATLPRTNAPDLLGPETGLNAVLNNNFPGISRGPNGYIYCSNRRDVVSNPPNLQIYDANLVLVWNSLYNSGANDYFLTAAGGLADAAVSPDGLYVAALGLADNRIAICSLTNGIPDVSTLYVITNTITTANGRGICWDAADNVYVSSSGAGALQEWTLGLTATAVTTGFSLVLPNNIVSVVASNSIGSAIVSQANTYGNPTNAAFVITRTGNSSSPWVIPFTVAGTAPGGSYSISVTGSVTLAAGQTVTNINVTAITDGIARPTTTITLTVALSGSYTAVPNSATLFLLNTATNQLVLAAKASSMYNVFSNDYASFTITRLGDTNAPTFSVSLTYGGSAVAGTDYTMPASATFNPGDISYTNFIYPLSNGQLPVDSSTNAYVGNKTVVVGINSGAGYTPPTNTVVLNILDSAYPTTAVLFADDLTDPNDVTNWNVTAANNNMQTNAIDNTVLFGYDLQNGNPSTYGAIPLPPSGAANGLHVSVNKSSVAGAGASAGVNLYPTNVSFGGNYAVRFSMNIVEGLVAANTTEGPIFGINHSGIATNWWTGSALSSGWGAPPSTNWESDGIWFWISADGGASAGDFLEYTGLGGVLPNAGRTLLATKTRASFATAYKAEVFTSSGKPGLPSNNSIRLGYPANNWADVEIKQFNNIVTLLIDKTTVFVYTNTTSFTNGLLMLGYADPFSSVGGPDGSVYYSNLRVVALAPPVITQIALNNLNGTVVINFTTVDGDLIASSFAVQGAAAVNDPYSDIAGAAITPLSAGAFQAVVPQSGPPQFYRIRVK